MSKQDIKELNKIISINKDAAKFYRSAQEKVESSDLEQNFSALENLHNNVAMNLRQEVVGLGGEVEDDQTITGQVTQFYGELMTKISPNPDEMLVTHLEEAEDRCMNTVKEVIEQDNLQASTKMTLQKELQSLRRSHDYMKAVKDYMKEAA